MRLVPLEIGRLETAMRPLSGVDETRTLPIPAWLIEHPDGLVLFDTGMHLDLQASSDRIGASAARFTPDFAPGEEVSAQLDKHSIRPSDIDRIIISHLHFDHSGGCGEIPDARMVVQEAEWAAGHDHRYIEAGHYNVDDFDYGHDVQQVTGQHDVFGDGRVICIPTPGHTPGHQSLRLELDSGPVVLTADCVYFEDYLETMFVPLLTGKRGREQQRQSMEALKVLRDQDGCRLLFGHDQVQFASLPADGLT